MVGDELFQILEQGWENELWVICMLGKYSICQSMSLFVECDMVIGLEMGILNVVGYMFMLKIVFLLYSLVNNLMKYWVNMVVIEFVSMYCYLCYVMYYSFEYCNWYEGIGIVFCVVNIDFEIVWVVFDGYLWKVV